MAGKNGATHIDDEPQQRESPVRHAHAVRASRHGRASTPGYLGLPADEDEGHGVDLDDDEEYDEETGSEHDESDEESDEDSGDENPRSRAPRARGGDTSARSREGGSSRGGSSASRRQSSSRSGSSRTAGRGKSTEKQQSGGGRSQSKGTSKAKAGGKRPGAGGSRGGGTQRRSASRSASKSGTSKSAPSARSAKRSSTAQKSSSRKRGTDDSAGERTKSAASSVKRAVSSVAGRAEGGLRRRAAREALHLAGILARQGLSAAAHAGAHALSRAGANGAETLLERVQRMPIQQSIDVAVPTAVAWEQWTEFTYFPEGSRRVVDVERDGDMLQGHLDGLTSRDWEAEIIDERENESFAWRSTRGSDSAGLVTFHELADRLTRLELNLDVRPTDLADAAGLALRVADLRVRSELRRFKAHAELLSPDIYDELLESSNGGPPEDERDSPPEDG